MIAHRQMGLSLLHTGEIAEGRAHLDRAIALDDPGEHRHFGTRFFGQHAGAAILCWRSLALLLLGHPDAALMDTKEALKIGRDSAHSATLTYALNFSVFQHVYCGDFAAANALLEEFTILKDQIGSGFWGGWGLALSGCVSTLTGRAAEAVQNIASGVIAMRSTETPCGRRVLNASSAGQCAAGSIQNSLEQYSRSDDRGQSNKGDLVRS